jgi:hypothetical protein
MAATQAVRGGGPWDLFPHLRLPAVFPQASDSLCVLCGSPAHILRSRHEKAAGVHAEHR